MNKLALAVIVVPIIIGVTVAGFLEAEGLNTPRATVTSTTATCSTPTPAPTLTDVYQIAPGSTGSICVDYAFQSNGAYSVPSGNYGPLSVSSGGWSYEACGAANGTNILTCPGLDVTPSTAEFDHHAGELISVSFTVQATMNADGLYLLFVASCDPIILAIGPVPASVPLIATSCVSSVGSPAPTVTISGVSNINAVVVPIQGTVSSG